MRILVTNDDGIDAPGLAVLEQIAEQIAGPQGEVWTIAPAYEQSGVGHCISYARPALLKEIAPRRFAIEGTPADCVIAARHILMADTLPDLVLSGINSGNNSAENALYSGTLGGAMEGALQGLRAIALSQYFGPGNKGLENPFEAALHHGATAIRTILETTPQHSPTEYALFHNVNFPPVAATAVKGHRIVAQGKRANSAFVAQATQSPNGRRYMWISPPDQSRPSGAGTDGAVNLEGYVSITPMRADLTAHDCLSLSDTASNGGQKT